MLPLQWARNGSFGPSTVYCVTSTGIAVIYIATLSLVAELRRMRTTNFLLQRASWSTTDANIVLSDVGCLHSKILFCFPIAFLCYSTGTICILEGTAGVG